MTQKNYIYIYRISYEIYTLYVMIDPKSLITRGWGLVCEIISGEIYLIKTLE